MQYLLLDGADWRFKEFLGEDWVWRNAHKRNTGDVRFWKPGSVPSAVTSDLYRCGEIPDPYYEKNSLLLEWIPERTWVYRKTFRIPEEMRGKDLKLCFDGIDYEAQIYFNDVLLGEHKGMFTSCAFDVTELAEQEGENYPVNLAWKA